MGGNLAVTIREENGQEHRMDRWTNPQPWFINNMDLVTKCDEHIRNYLNTWYGFREDWEENKEQYFKNVEEAKKTALEKGEQEWQYYKYVPQTFKYNMTNIYAGHPFLCPSEYGQVVIDMVNNKILHSQGYCAFGEISCISVRTCLHQDGDKSFWERDEHGASIACCLREFFEAGKVLGIQTWDAEGKEEIFEEAPKSVDDLWQYLNKDRSRNWARFMLDMSPFEVIRFEESEEGFKKFKQAILDLNFVLTEEEDKMWDECIAERFQKNEK